LTSRPASAARDPCPLYRLRDHRPPTPIYTLSLHDALPIYGQSNNNRSSSFYMCNQVAIYGGFAGTETDINQRDWQQHVTMLSGEDRKSTRLNSSHVKISYAAFCLKKKRKWSWSAASTDSIA